MLQLSRQTEGHVGRSGMLVEIKIERPHRTYSGTGYFRSLPPQRPQIALTLVYVGSLPPHLIPMLWISPFPRPHPMSPCPHHAEILCRRELEISVALCADGSIRCASSDLLLFRNDVYHVLPTVQPSVGPTYGPFDRPSVRPMVRPSVRPSVRPPDHRTVRLSVRPTVRLSTVRPPQRPSIGPRGCPTV